MEHNKYSPVKKGILIILNVIFVPILLISLVIVVSCLAEFGGDFKRFSDNKKYAESQALIEDLKMQTYDLADYISLQELLETKGTLDENKIIDIMDYSTDSYVPGRKEHPLGYRLGDLLNWSGSYAEWRESGNSFYGYEQAVEGSVSKVADSSEAPTYDRTEWFTDMEKLYQPEGYNSIDDYVEKNKSNRTQCVNALWQALDIIPEQLRQYQSYEKSFVPKNSNIIYEAINSETNQKFSNGLIKDIKGKSVTVEAEVDAYKIKIGIDTAFPAEDNFYYANVSYNKFIPYLEPIFIVMLLGLLTGGTTFVWITLLSGHSGKQEGITLMLIDKLPTEICIVIWTVIGTLSVTGIAGVSGFNMYDMNNYNFYTITMGGILAVLIYGLFLTGYLSLVRIIKARTFVKNSICYRFCKSFKMAVYGGKSARKVIAVFAAYLIIQFILSTGYWWGGLGFVIAIVINIFIARIIYKDVAMRRRVLDGIRIIAAGDMEYQIPIDGFQGSNKELAEAVNKIGDGLHRAVESSMKNERMKTDLITNVSHDIKTPLTSIVNYVDLLKRENIQDAKIKGYIDILDNKSQRLKQLTDDLVEASKVSSGNITLELMNVDYNELLQQTIGEFEDKFKVKELELIINHPNEPVIIEADGRRIWRVLENLFNNIVKYAMPSTRVYIDLYTVDNSMKFTVKNVSEHALNIKAEELTERFIRGDVSRSTEGSGLGLSIAKELTTLQKGEFEIYLDGDLFKVTISFQRKSEKE